MSYHQPPPPPPGGGQPYGPGGQPGFGPPPHLPGQVAPPAHGFLQQGPYAPQGPYALHPQPGGAPYGMPPVKASGGGRGRAIGLAVGGAVLVAAIVGGLVVLGGADDARYELTTPARVAAVFDREGAGSSGSDMSAADRRDLEQLPGVVDPQPVAAEYTSPDKRKLMLTGVWGRVEKPEQVVDAMFLVAAKSLTDQDTTPVGSPETLKPEGLDGDAVMKCQKFRISAPAGSGGPSSVDVPLCIWGDSSTVAAILEVNPLAAVTGNVNVSETAETAAKVRTDARVEIEQ